MKSSRSLSLTLLIALSTLPGLALSATAAPKYGKHAVPLSEDSSYFKTASKTDFWKLIPYYVPQHNDKACGVASSIMALNMLFAPERNTSDSQNVDVEEAFKLSTTFKKNVGPQGKGFPLDELGETLTKVLEAATPGAYSVRLERFDGKDSAAEIKRLEKLLAANERNPNDVILVNYLQGILTGDKDGLIGHIAPIGAYDSKTKRVLILDPDRKHYQPYWSPAVKLFDAMNTTDPSKGKKRGLVVISRNNG